jgi:hypothetical protein
MSFVNWPILSTIKNQAYKDGEGYGNLSRQTDSPCIDCLVRAQFDVLSIEEYQFLREHLDDMEDLLDLRSAKAEKRNAPTVALAEVKR